MNRAAKLWHSWSEKERWTLKEIKAKALGLSLAEYRWAVKCGSIRESE